MQGLPSSVLFQSRFSIATRLQASKSCCWGECSSQPTLRTQMREVHVYCCSRTGAFNMHCRACHQLASLTDCHGVAKLLKFPFLLLRSKRKNTHPTPPTTNPLKTRQINPTKTSPKKNTAVLAKPPGGEDSVLNQWQFFNMYKWYNSKNSLSQLIKG